MKKIRVLVVDDSLFIRQLFTGILQEDPAIEVAGTAGDPYEAREKIKELNPDVITLDIEMPKMDGLSFLEKIMALRPMPVVMVSSLTQKGAEATIRALEIGAVDVVPKQSSHSFDIQGLKDELIAKVKAAAASKARLQKPLLSGRKAITSFPRFRAGALIAIGASTGGVEALGEVITRLPANSPPVLVTQHMPKGFTAIFASRLDGISQVKVWEAAHGQTVEPGNVYIAPGDYHLQIAPRGKSYICLVTQGEKVSGHRPSVDVMFESFASVAGADAVAAILTGMGRDGAQGMLKMKRAGAFTAGQDEASSVVYGMPKAAYLAGAVDVQAPLEKIAETILGACAEDRKSAAG